MDHSRRSVGEGYEALKLAQVGPGFFGVSRVSDFAGFGVAVAASACML